MSELSKIKKTFWIIFTVIAGGLAMVGLIIFFLRTGGLIKMVVAVLVLLIGYLTYETVRKINRK
jgi:hypothetical protein